ncbi:preprotein translocase subunit SecA [Pelagicoccus sp. NFK12]|uniref:Protein translocase subunit SecA n=1 Tax=Pelagicoccus enzymogenes TaxID=2773457 RepID=A0A927IGI5_9BACT|nr:preprotein translocase subunit SecA [Pelagicoccus enzymogenes]MBD5778708.1 preprotein translocase subunit SecA [Pelagicoccus enzymogenes]MDQ8197545.1 preprotein translocase subunit SecA [Pelagicoccus enzymogenes]
MLSSFFKKFAGRSNKKWLKSCEPAVAKINELEASYQSLSDEELKAHTAQFRERFANGESLDDLLPEAFATVKNAARRLVGTSAMVCGREQHWDMVHYDVQLIGGMALHQGRIAEMATGEGKTLVSTLPIYLNALASRNVQLVTVNEYLAQRDSEWMGHLFKYLGLTVGCIKNQQPPPVKREMYGCDVTYGTASEFGFDYLRDNGMAHSKEEQVQRDHFFVIIDEVDSILVDEARTPLIISGPAPIQREQPYTKLKGAIESLVNAQNKLCNSLIAEVKEELGKEERDTWDLGLKMLQVKLGMPKNKQLLRLLETGEYRKLLDKTDLEMHSDMNKDKLFDLKEELYFVIDEKQRQADLTEKGRKTLRPDNPDAFVLPDLATRFSELDKDASLSSEEKDAIKLKEQEALEVVGEDIHAISQLLRAYALYEKDVEYVVQEGKVVIVDENTGRVMAGRRWGDGLHQAVEAKENVTIERETRTFATVTVQNYFRLYEKLAGMTGTAETEATEFHDIYNLGVAVIPTNRPCIRIDDNDVIYKSRREKYNAVVDEVEAAHKKGQPVLVGTVSVEASELVGRMLRRKNIPHNVLNAKFHQQEAEIVARAGIKGAVTIATNMAGRGTDIKLGEGVKEAGGLLVIGTERHESRRIDRQLRGRCSRQGDPGRSKFYISLEDDLMRLFANSGFMAKILHGSMEEGEPLEHSLLNRSIETAQKKVEGSNYSVRKRLLQYDDVLNKQREIIYSLRNDALQSDTPFDTVMELVEEEVADRLADAERDLAGFVTWANSHFPIGLSEEALGGKSAEAQLKHVLDAIRDAYRIKKTAENEAALEHLERYVLLSSIDGRWQEHLTEMEDLRRNVGLRSYGQKDPLNEYKNEAYTYFEELMSNVRAQVCTRLFRTATNLVAIENVKNMLARQAVAQGGGAETSGAVAARPGGRPAQGSQVQLPKVTIKKSLPKVGRNEPCPCGSGKKFKQCCGR